MISVVDIVNFLKQARVGSRGGGHAHRFVLGGPKWTAAVTGLKSKVHQTSPHP